MLLSLVRPHWRHLLGSTFAVVLSFVIVIFLLKLVAVRRRFLALQKQGLVKPLFPLSLPPLSGEREDF